MPHKPAQLGWVQAPGRLDQDRVGVGGDVGWQLVGAVGHHPSMGHRHLPGHQGRRRIGKGATE